MKKYFSAVFILMCLLVNFSAKAADGVFYFDKNTSVAPSELLTAHSSEAPAPVVKIYYPRVDFSSGKNKPVIFEESKNLRNYFRADFFLRNLFSREKAFHLPVYLMNGVFLI